ncbi:hypothetical protein ABZV75_01455 [Streptomyces flaveolus]|uniref:hypothetical protein n=1 Tax=Streptomyces flaveolus TaxID=67297 RepID=UPI0033A9B8F9
MQLQGREKIRILLQRLGQGVAVLPHGVRSSRVPAPELTSSPAPDGWVCLLSGGGAISGDYG